MSGVKGTATKTEHSKFKTGNKSRYIDDDDITYNNEIEPQKPQIDSEYGSNHVNILQ